ncbi:MAG: hypothetical protein ACTSWE_11635 [Promethearchaeota archaeon]
MNKGFISRFVEFLTYIAEKTGKKVIRIDEKAKILAHCIFGKLLK